MNDAHPHPLSRRALLGAVGAGALVAIAGCNPFSTGQQTITVTAPATTSAPPPPSPAELLGLIFTTRLHVQSLTEAIASDKRDAATFTMLLADRKAHLTALDGEYRRQFGAAPPADSSSAPPSPTSTASADPDEVIGRIRGDASTAQIKFTDALTGATRFQAQLYGSIAACVATHRMVLS